VQYLIGDCGTTTTTAPVFSWIEPQNPGVATQQRRLSQEDCDKKIASTFGGSGAVAATATEPSTLQHPSAGRDRSNHLANNGTFHLYTNAQGANLAVGLYTPAGWRGRPVSGTAYQGPNNPNPGEVNYNTRFNYRGGLSISFVHLSNQRINRSDRNVAGSIRIGNINGAGTGGEGAGYHHTHVNVYQNGTRVDPRKIYCGW
jgi:hypothetical protein